MLSLDSFLHNFLSILFLDLYDYLDDVISAYDFYLLNFLYFHHIFSSKGKSEQLAIICPSSIKKFPENFSTPPIYWTLPIV